MYYFLFPVRLAEGSSELFSGRAQAPPPKKFKVASATITKKQFLEQNGMDDDGKLIR